MASIFSDESEFVWPKRTFSDDETDLAVVDVPDEDEVENRLSEKLMKGYMLLEQQCPVCTVPLVKEPASGAGDDNDSIITNHTLDSPIILSSKLFEKGVDPLVGIPFCVMCHSHIITDQQELELLERMQTDGGLERTAEETSLPESMIKSFLTIETFSVTQPSGSKSRSSHSSKPFSPKHNTMNDSISTTLPAHKLKGIKEMHTASHEGQQGYEMGFFASMDETISTKSTKSVSLKEYKSILEVHPTSQDDQGYEMRFPTVEEQDEGEDEEPRDTDSDLQSSEPMTYENCDIVDEDALEDVLRPDEGEIQNIVSEEIERELTLTESGSTEYVEAPSSVTEEVPIFEEGQLEVKLSDEDLVVEHEELDDRQGRDPAAADRPEEVADNSADLEETSITRTKASLRLEPEGAHQSAEMNDDSDDEVAEEILEDEEKNESETKLYAEEASDEDIFIYSNFFEKDETETTQFEMMESTYGSMKPTDIAELLEGGMAINKESAKDYDTQEAGGNGEGAQQSMQYLVLLKKETETTQEESIEDRSTGDNLSKSTKSDAATLAETVSHGSQDEAAHGQSTEDKHEATLSKMASYESVAVEEESVFNASKKTAPESDIEEATLESLTVRDEEDVMREYTVRREIATKVLGTKMLQGYSLKATQCEKCDMPMMEYKSVLQCVVCPVLARKAEKLTKKAEKLTRKTEKLGKKSSAAENLTGKVADTMMTKEDDLGNQRVKEKNSEAMDQRPPASTPRKTKKQLTKNLDEAKEMKKQLKEIKKRNRAVQEAKPLKATKKHDSSMNQGQFEREQDVPAEFSGEESKDSETEQVLTPNEAQDNLDCTGFVASMAPRDLKTADFRRHQLEEEERRLLEGGHLSYSVDDSESGDSRTDDSNVQVQARKIQKEQLKLIAETKRLETMERMRLAGEIGYKSPQENILAGIALQEERARLRAEALRQAEAKILSEARRKARMEANLAEKELRALEEADMIESLEQEAERKAKEAEEAVAKAKAAMDEVQSMKRGFLAQVIAQGEADLLAETEAIVRADAEDYHQEVRLSPSALRRERWETLRIEGRSVTTRRLLSGWTMLPRYCKGAECQNSPLLANQANKKVECVVCGGSGTGEDGVYSEAKQEEITEEEDSSSRGSLVSAPSGQYSMSSGIPAIERLAMGECLPEQSVKDLKKLQEDFEEKRNMVSKEIAKRMLQGWTLLDLSCPNCIMPLLTDDQCRNEICVLCGVIGKLARDCTVAPCNFNTTTKIESSGVEGSHSCAAEKACSYTALKEIGKKYTSTLQVVELLKLRGLESSTAVVSGENSCGVFTAQNAVAAMVYPCSPRSLSGVLPEPVAVIEANKVPSPPFDLVASTAKVEPTQPQAQTESKSDAMSFEHLAQKLRRTASQLASKSLKHEFGEMNLVSSFKQCPTDETNETFDEMDVLSMVPVGDASFIERMSEVRKKCDDSTTSQNESSSTSNTSTVPKASSSVANGRKTQFPYYPPRPATSTSSTSGSRRECLEVDTATGSSTHGASTCSSVAESPRMTALKARLRNILGSSAGAPPESPPATHSVSYSAPSSPTRGASKNSPSSLVSAIRSQRHFAFDDPPARSSRSPKVLSRTSTDCEDSRSLRSPLPSPFPSSPTKSSRSVGSSWARSKPQPGDTTPRVQKSSDDEEVTLVIPKDFDVEKSSRSVGSSWARSKPKPGDTTPRVQKSSDDAEITLVIPKDFDVANEVQLRDLIVAAKTGKLTPSEGSRASTLKTVETTDRNITQPVVGTLSEHRIDFTDNNRSPIEAEATDQPEVIDCTLMASHQSYENKGAEDLQINTKRDGASPVSSLGSRSNLFVETSIVEISKAGSGHAPSPGEKEADQPNTFAPSPRNLTRKHRPRVTPESFGRTRICAIKNAAASSKSVSPSTTTRALSTFTERHTTPIPKTISSPGSIDRRVSIDPSASASVHNNSSSSSHSYYSQTATNMSSTVNTDTLGVTSWTSRSSGRPPISSPERPYRSDFRHDIVDVYSSSRGSHASGYSSGVDSDAESGPVRSTVGSTMREFGIDAYDLSDVEELVIVGGSRNQVPSRVEKDYPAEGITATTADGTITFEAIIGRIEKLRVSESGHSRRKRDLVKKFATAAADLDSDISTNS